MEQKIVSLGKYHQKKKKNDNLKALLRNTKNKMEGGRNPKYIKYIVRNFINSLYDKQKET